MLSILAYVQLSNFSAGIETMKIVRLNFIVIKFLNERNPNYSPCLGLVDIMEVQITIRVGLDL